MLHQMPIFTMDRNKVPGPHQGHHHLEFFLAGVSRHMNFTGRFIKDFSATPVQVIDQTVDGLFVAGDKLGGKDNRIPFIQGQRFELVHGHAHQGTLGFALAAGGQNHHTVWGQIPRLADIDQHIIRDFEIAQVPGDTRIGLHATPGDHNFAPAVDRCLHNLLNTVDIRRKGGDDHPFTGSRHNLGKRGRHFPLRQGKPLFLHIGGIGKQQQYAFLTVCRQSNKIGGLVINRGLIQFKIPGMDHPSRLGTDRHTIAVDDGMRHAKQFDMKRPEFERRARRHRNQVGPSEKFVLLQPMTQQPQSQRRTVNSGKTELLKQKRHRTDMILMTVGEHQPPDTIKAPFQTADVGNDQIDTRHVRLGEHQTAVDKQQVAPIFHRHHVQADFPQPSQRQNTHGIGRQRRRHRGKRLGHDCKAFSTTASMGARTSSRRVVRSWTSRPAVCTAGKIVTWTTPPRIQRLCFGITSRLPVTAIGTIGACA